MSDNQALAISPPPQLAKTPELFSYLSYKQYLNDWLLAQPGKGRGLLSRIAENLRLSPSMMTLVLKGEKHLSSEAACDLSEFLGHNEEECNYFLLLVQFERAGSHKLRSRLETLVRKAQSRSHEIKNTMKPDREVPEAAKSVFYSSWLYSGIRNLVACEDFRSIEALAARLPLSLPVIEGALRFLLESRMLEFRNGKLYVGSSVTHLSPDEPHVIRHHQNWRLQAMQKFAEKRSGQLGRQDIFFTAPMSLSSELAAEIDRKIATFLQEVREAVGPSKSETVRCLNIDWFEY